MSNNFEELKTVMQKHFDKANQAGNKAIQIHKDKADHPPKTREEMIQLTEKFIELMEEATKEKGQALSILKQLEFEGKE